ncbi:hypothetical protein PRUB_a1525 [Pseudoalteromonas rubra]|uniref:Uncharacterized protein n=1 Tax=Pseudoalteromonas rubra TaxID=43658 RepID=A0A8T0CCQ5_9GAMM|nr:DUF3962 domain-containing protein [Pseudoalteromonas rubra]KAF7788537.1 hypothetical protein PRUB_a1525 [Pseudoalteromonas rubra]
MSFGLKTTTMFLPVDAYGSVTIYTASNEFTQAWERLKQKCSLKYLPYASLANMLRWHFGHFIRFSPFGKELNGGKVFIVSESNLDLDTLAMMFDSWELEVCKYMHEPVLGQLIRNGAFRQHRVRIEDHIVVKTNSCPTADDWVWDAAKWSVARQFISSQLAVDNNVKLELVMDSEARLLTWDNCLKSEFSDMPVRAMHVITPRLITVPGFDLPAMHFESSISRLASTWKDSNLSPIKTAWIEIGSDKPVLQTAIDIEKGTWKKRWRDISIQLLNKNGLEFIREPEEYDLSQGGNVRARYQSAPIKFPIGKGVGNPFHHYVSNHMKQTFPNGEALILRKSVNRLPKRAKLAEVQKSESQLRDIVSSTGKSTLELICVYSSYIVRKRLLQSFKSIVNADDSAQFDEKDNVWMSYGPYKIKFISPLHCERLLLQLNDENTIIDWAEAELSVEHYQHKNDSIKSMIIETCEDQTLRDGAKSSQLDPKPILKKLLALQGVNSQFVRASTLDKVDDSGVCHGAVRAIHDVFRVAGSMLIPFEPLNGSSKKTWYLGVFTQKSKSRRISRSSAEFHIGLTACLAGEHETYMYSYDKKWAPYHESVVSQWSKPLRYKTPEEVEQFIASGIRAWRDEHPEDAFVILLDGITTRRFWPGLQDTKLGTSKLPVNPDDADIAIVRYRTQNDIIPRPAGKLESDNSSSELLVNPGMRFGIFHAEKSSSERVYYCTQPSTTASKDFARNITRFASKPIQLKDDRHAQTLTELVIVANNICPDNELVLSASKLCFQSLSWLGNQKTIQPSPIHLASGAIEDYVEVY